MLTLLEIPYIEAHAIDVVEVMRSPEPAILVKGKTFFSSQAYIGTIQRGDRQVVYTVLHVREIHSSVIFESSETTAELAREEGEKLLNSMGFRLEPISLQFSPAMREVALRDIPVILAPEMAQKIYQEKESQRSKWLRLIQEPEGETSAENGALAIAKKTAAEHLAAEDRMTGKLAIFREIIEGHLQQIKAMKVAATERLERKRLQAMLVTAQAATAEMTSKISRLEEELAAEKTERNSLAQAKSAADVLHTKYRQQLENRMAAMEEELRLARALIDLGGKDRAVAALALGTAEQQLTEQRLAEQQLEEEQLTKQRLAEQRLAEQRLAEQRLAEQRLAEQRLAEQRLAEQRLAEQRLAEQRQAEQRRLLIQKTTAEKLLPEMELVEETTAVISINAVEESKPKSQRPPEPSPPHVVRRPPAADAFFQVDWDLAGVPYGSPEDICEVRKSISRVRLRMEGYPEQYCSVCLLIVKSGEKKNIFLAFNLLTDKRVLVYVPIKPTDTPPAFAVAAKEAEKYLQVVGFEIETIPLSDNPQQRAKTLEAISSLIIRQ